MANQSIIYCDGDSITVGYPGLPNPYPTLLSPVGAPWFIINGGVTGRTLATMYADGASAVDPDYSAGQRNIDVIWGGTNDFVVNGSTPAAVYAILQEYCAARRAVGWKVIVVTMISRYFPGGNPVSGESIDADKDAYNALIRANWSTFADGLADVAANPNLGADGAYANLTYFQADQVHPTQFSITNIEAPIIGGAVNLLLNSGGTAPQNPPPAYIQSNADFGSSPTQNTPFLSANSAGSLLTAYVRTNVTTITVTDSQGNIWQSLPQINNGAICQFWYALNANRGANTVTVTTITGSVVDLLIAEYSGVSAFDAYAQTTTGATQSPTVSVTTAEANELLVAYTANQTAGAVTAGTNMTAMRQNVSNVVAIGDGKALAKGANSIGFSTATSFASIVGVAAFKPTTANAKSGSPVGLGTDISAASQVETNSAGQINSSRTSVFGVNLGTRSIG